MLWIKRNLFLAVSGLILLTSMGAGGYFLYTNKQKNSSLTEEVESTRKSIESLQKKKPYPSQENIKLAQEQLGIATNAVNASRHFFQAVPAEAVTGLAFKTLLDNSIAELRRKAKAASVQLPGEDYAFSFRHEKEALRLPASSFPALPQQLAEVKTICEILFDAKINFLDGIRRPALPESSSPSYHSLSATTNKVTGMVETPYEVSFICFSTELARIMERLHRSVNGLVLKTIQVEAVPPEPPPGAAKPPANSRLAAAPPKPALETVIDERRLKTTMFINVIKPSS